MKFGAMSIDLRRLPLEDAFRISAVCGFKGLEIFGNGIHLSPALWNEDLKRQVLKLKEDYMLDIPMYTPGNIGMGLNICSVDPRERQMAVEYYKKAVGIAHEIGSPAILVVADHPGFVATRRTLWGYLVESMKQICAEGEAKGIKIVIEQLTPVESPMVMTADDCLQLIEDVKSPALYAMMDIVPPTVMHEPISRYFELLKDRLYYIHICNTDGATDAHFRLDNGILNIPEIIHTINSYGYDGYVTSELYSEAGTDAEVLLRSTAAYLKNICTDLNIENNFT